MGDYRGTIEVARQGGGVAVVNEVGLEDYVRGIQEMPPTWPAAALEAQAIAARTYALSSAASATATPWRAAGADICATDSCQVYRGLAAERQPGGASWVAAVAATEGQVLLSGERPILAMYSSSNGGRTKAGAAWYLRATADPDDATSPLSHWHYTLPLAALAPVLNVRPPVTLVGLRRVGGSVVLTVTSPGQPPSDHAIGSGDFMSALNRGVPAPAGLPAPLPTADFAVGTDGASAVVDGHGWGHGIGMSQYGAYGKARRGWQAADILAAYYGGIRPAVVPTGEPETIRVALQVGGGSARVTSAGPFRVVDRDGVVVVPEASGEWRFTPASGGVRVAPPAGWDQTQLDAVPTLAPAGMARRSPARVLVAAPAFPARRALVLLALALTAWAGGMTLRVHRGRRIPLL
jgi:stage II sporulation protein D